MCLSINFNETCTDVLVKSSLGSVTILVFAVLDKVFKECRNNLVSCLVFFFDFPRDLYFFMK